MTYEQAFLKIKEKFDNADASNLSDFAIQITFSDEDCSGKFYAHVYGGVLYVEPYDYADNNLAITITKSALLAYLAGRSTLDKIIANGEAYVESGDISRMADWRSTIKKASAKKEAAKKTPVKKETKKAAQKKTAAAKSETKTVAKTETKKAAAPVKTETKTVTAAAKKAALKK